jgi:HPt (histidine-containing phosphotransfer) domain-containing protein
MLEDSGRCLAAGCNEYLAKPINRRQLIQTIAAYVGKQTAAGAATSGPTDDVPAREGGAIVSQYADDPEIAEILGGFVERLAGQVDAMRQALADGREEELKRLAHRLKGAGGSYGYPRLTEACKVLEEAAQAHETAAEAAAFAAVAALSQAIEQGYTEFASLERTS